MYGNDASGLEQFSTPQVLYTYFYNHTHRLRFEKTIIQHLEFFAVEAPTANGHHKPLLDPGGETAVTLHSRFSEKTRPFSF
jgi:hypothetical protein